jgi:hypothetical protein
LPFDAPCARRRRRGFEGKHSKRNLARRHADGRAGLAESRLRGVESRIWLGEDDVQRRLAAILSADVQGDRRMTRENGLAHHRDALRQAGLAN